MTKNDLYIEILSKLADYLKQENIITEAQKAEMDEEIYLMHYDAAVSKIKDLPSTVQFKKIAKLILAGLDDTTEISNTLQVRHHQASLDNKERLKAFSYKKSTLAVLPVKTIIYEVRNTAIQDFNVINSNILELIWLAYKDNSEELKYVWECCCGQHEDDYFLLTNEPDIPETNWRLYSYAYFCFVNENKFEKPAVLNFNKDEKFATVIPYNSRNKYEQYFDAYNVISESKHADDVLLRYLRMYQILEYFGYRRILADMTKGNIRENGFVRNLISKVSARSGTELTEIKNGVSDLLPHLATKPPRSGLFVSTDITPQMESFIKNKLLLGGYSFCDDHLWNVIYKLRNCIVHNKESELHFTYTNTDDYTEGINLMRLFIQKLEPEIINLINDSNITGLEFVEQRVQVY